MMSISHLEKVGKFSLKNGTVFGGSYFRMRGIILALGEKNLILPAAKSHEMCPVMFTFVKMLPKRNKI
jgi:hypothetical protein